jgi:hypothetical protein
MVLIAMTHPYCQNERIAKRGKSETASNAIAAKMPTVLTNRSCSIPPTKDIYPRSKSRLSIWRGAAMASAIPQIERTI